MERISGPTVDVDLFGTGKHGFTEGSPGVEPATLVRKGWINALQEEVAGVIEALGLDLVPGDNTQLLDAVLEHANRQATMRAVGVAIGSHASRTAPTAVNYRKIAYGAADAIFVACNNGASGPHTSPDGVTWSNRSIAPLHDACYAQGRFLCVGPAAAMVTSENGTSYTARTPAGGFASDFFCCAANSSVFIAAGETGEIQTSANGTTGWTQRTPAASFAGTWFGAAYARSQIFVLVGASAPNVTAIQTTSDNGTTWVSRTPSTSGGELYSVARGLDEEDVLIAVGASSVGSALMMRSVDDGATWANVTPPSGHTQAYNDVKYDDDNHVFVAVGYGGQIAISRNGASGTWKSVSRASFTSTLNGIAFGDGTAVLCGDSSALRQSLAYALRS